MDVRREGKRLYIKATPADHYRIQRWMDRAKAEPKNDTTQSKTVTIKRVSSSRQKLLETIAGQLKVELLLEGANAEALEARVTLEPATEVSYQELLELTLDGSGLEYELGPSLLIIRDQQP